MKLLVLKPSWFFLHGFYLGLLIICASNDSEDGQNKQWDAMFDNLSTNLPSWINALGLGENWEGREICAQSAIYATISQMGNKTKTPGKKEGDRNWPQPTP